MKMAIEIEKSRCDFVNNVSFISSINSYPLGVIMKKKAFVVRMPYYLFRKNPLYFLLT